MNTRTGAQRALNSNGLTNNLGLDAVAAKLHAALIYNSGAATWYATVHFRLPGDGEPNPGDVPSMVCQVPSKSTGSIDWGSGGRPVPEGKLVWISVSTNDVTHVEGPVEAIIDITYS